MATRDTAQLILEVDARIATAQRAVNQLARSIQQDAAGMDNSLKKIEQSSERVGKSLGGISARTRSGFTQLSFQIGDVTQGLALGTKASTIFAQQAGQTIQALQSMGGEGNAFLRFLGGPWGLALSTAAVVLGTFAGKLFDNRDELTQLVDKMREQAAQASNQKEANEIWQRSIEGVTEAIQKQKEELDKKQSTPRSDLQDSLQQARSQEDIAKRLLAKLIATKEQVEKQIAGLKAVIDAAVSEESVNAAAQLLGPAESRLANLERLIREQRDKIKGAAADIRGYEAEIGKLDVAAALDPVVAATQHLEEAQRKLDEQRRAGLITQKQYNDQLLIEKKRLEDVKKAQQDANKSGVAQFKSSVIGAEGTGPNRLGSSAAGFGQFMPSTFLSYFNRLFPDKAQLSDAAKLEFRNVREVAVAVIDRATDDYVKVLKAAGQQITAANLYAVHLLGARDAKKLFAAAPGTDTSQFLSAAVLKGNPFLKGTAASARAAIGKRIGDSSGAVSSGAAAIDRELAEQAKRALAEQNAFEEQRDKLNQDLFRAQNDLVEGINEQADIAEQQVRSEQARRDAALQNDVEEGKLTQAHADELKAVNASIAAEKIKAIEIDRQVKLIQQQDEDRQRTFQYQIDDLRFADEMAKTQAEKRRLELQIIDVLYQQKEAHLQALKAELELAGKIEEAADVQSQIDRLPTEKAQDQSRTYRNTQGPLEQYFSQVPQTVDEANEAMQRLEVQGIDGAINAVIALTDGFDSFRDTALSAIKAIIAELIRMQLMKLALNIVGAASGSPGIGGGIGSSLTALNGGTMLIENHADGGYITGPGTATSDSIPAMLSNGEFVVNAGAVRSFGAPFFDAINSGRLTPQQLAGGAAGGGFGGLGFGMGAKLLAKHPEGVFGLAGLLLPKLFSNGGYVGIPKMRVPSMRAANTNTPGSGHTFNISVAAPNTGNPRRDRMTALQQAADIKRAVATVTQKGAVA